MKRVLILLLAVASAPALAGGWHGHSRVIVGFNFGYPVPVYAPWYYYPPPAYYYPPAVYAPPGTPMTYVERSDLAEQAAPAQPPASWYFCREANGYYPYVKQCPGGWVRVPAQPN